MYPNSIVYCDGLSLFYFLYTDCPIAGQEYNEVKANCPKTCSNPHLLCAGEGRPGCSCPTGQVIDEMNNRCVHPNDCPSKSIVMLYLREREKVNAQIMHTVFVIDF